MLIKKNAIIIIVCFCNLMFFFAQEKEERLIQEITLDYVIEKASKNSLDIFKAKRQYEVNYWEFRSFKASLLPKIDFSANPFTFNRALVERYDSEQNIDVYRLQQTVNSFANLSLSQNIAATGTRVFLNSSFNRLENFGISQLETYSTTPVRIGLNQPIMAFNRFKWQQKTAPLEYEIAKKDLIYDLQTINLKSVQLFFNWALASKKYQIAKENKTSAEKLYEIGKKRYKLVAIERDELLNLELDVYNAQTRLTNLQQNLISTKAALQLFLREELLDNAIPELPELISSLYIDTQKAIDLAFKNNPDFLDLELQKIEASRNLDRTVKENRFDLSIDASYGLNQQANAFANAYNNFLDQQMVAVKLEIPILDWGERRGNIKTAKVNKEVVDIEIQQNKDTKKQSILEDVQDFNAQNQLVVVALRSSEIAKESYQLTEKRFLSGSVDFLNLITSRNAWQNANENYIQTLQNYWRLYYKVQQNTLYNFLQDYDLIQDFKELIK